MQWDDARLFLAFAREGSFSGAAKRLGVRHSTVSRRIHALEEQLGSRLAERGASGYVLTEAGEHLKNSALRIENEFIEFEANSSGIDEDASGLLRVAAIANMASTILMPALARFTTAYPKIELQVEVTNKTVRLAEREADVALRQTNAPGETLIGTRLATVASTVYAERDYCKALISGDAKVCWVGVDCCDYHRTWTRKESAAGVSSLCVDDTSLTQAALQQGLGVGYLPCFLGDADPKLMRYREPDIQHNLGLWLLYHRDLKNTKRVRLFRAHMQAEIKTLIPLLDGSSGRDANYRLA